MNDAYRRLTLGVLYAGIIALFAALATYLVSGAFGNLTKILLIVGVGLLIGYVIANPEAVLHAFSGRGARYGGNTAAMIVLFVGIIGAGNYYVANHNSTYDVTANQSHTLSPQTIKILNDLKQPVTVTAFFQTGQPDEQQAKDLLQLYTSHTDKLKVTFVDPDKNPAEAQQFGIVSYGTTVFQSGGRRKDVPSVGEQEFTSALIAVTNQLQQKIYFVTGNGQPDPNNSDQTGYHDALVALQNGNYVVGTLGATITAVPDDAAAVILASGTQPLLPGEEKAFSAYLSKGGKMMILNGGFAGTDLNNLVKPFGLTFQQGIVVDPASSLPQDPTAPAVSQYADSSNEIVKNVSVSLFPVASGIQIAQPSPKGITTTVIAKTSGASWLQNHKDQAQFRDGDIRGPINLVVTAEGTLPAATPGAAGTPRASAVPQASGTPAAASSSGPLANPSVVATPPPATPTPQPTASGSPAANPQPTITPTPVANVSGASVNLAGGTKIVAVADTSWLNDTYLNQVPGNRDLFLNSINHLVGNTNLISITPKPASQNQVFLLGQDANLIFFTTVVFVPLVVLILGAVVWWQRR